MKCVSERVREVGIGCAGLLPDKTHHLDPKVPAVVVTNYELVNDSRGRQATKACSARVDHGTLTGKCRQEREEGESKARQGWRKGAHLHGARRGVNEKAYVAQP